LATIVNVLSQPRTLLACVVALSVVLAVVIFVSRSDRQSTPPTGKTGAVTDSESPVSDPHAPGVTISTSDERRSSPAANQLHKVRAAAADAGWAPNVAPNQAASLVPEASDDPMDGAPQGTLPPPRTSENVRAAQSPRAWLEPIR
jgi:hypothetical protein